MLTHDLLKELNLIVKSYTINQIGFMNNLPIIPAEQHIYYSFKSLIGIFPCIRILYSRYVSVLADI